MLHSHAVVSGRVAIVTGAASGIGRATALQLAKDGWAAVALVDRDAALLKDACMEVSAAGTKALAVEADLSDLERTAGLVGEVVGALRRVDTVVNCAAIARPSIDAVDYLTEDFIQDINVNLLAGFIIARDAARDMIARRSMGTIVFVASINAQGAGVGSIGYCASKAAVISAMKVLAAELGEHGIRVNSVSPGPSDTPRSVGRVGEKVMSQLRQRFDGAALRRLGAASEIADAIVYLASDTSSYVSGHDLVVDGGLLASVYVAAKPQS